MDEKILLVDDDPNVAAAFKRRVPRDFLIETALSAEEGLDLIAKKGPFAVVVSDFQMPGMDGIRFLSRIKELNSETVRILLTGHADFQMAIDAVNEGNIFRFLTKPCDAGLLLQVIYAGIEQYRLITAERELLEKTLSGSIQMLSNVLSLVNPTAFGRASRVHRWVRLLVNHIKPPDTWELLMASHLSHVGCVAVPEAVLQRAFQNVPLTDDEQRMMDVYPQIGHELISVIPRLEKVAQIIAQQNRRFDDATDEIGIPLGARILKVVQDFEAMESRGYPRWEAMAKLAHQPGCYDPAIIKAFTDALTQFEAGNRFLLKEVTVSELESNMIFAEDVKSISGLLLVSKGQEVTSPITLRLRNFLSNNAMLEPIRVLVPVTSQ